MLVIFEGVIKVTLTNETEFSKERGSINLTEEGIIISLKVLL